MESATADDNDQIVPSTTPLANSIMVFMVRRIFSSLKFPYAMFPCSRLLGEQLFMLFWDCACVSFGANWVKDKICRL